MAGVSLQSLTKAFGRTQVVADVDLDIRDGAFLALLGPSGCGKTTLLRLIAGLERPDAGRIVIDGETVVGDGVFTEAEDRRLGMVFQSYALWPHMSVADNVGFGLRVRRVPGPERRERVTAALRTVGLAEHGERRPAQLSGGQRQRAALARCLALEPRLILLDEPLANLDAHLRLAMQDEFRRIHQQFGTTFVYVTHDQVEAMALADSIAVMDRGRLQQVGTPQDLYERPQTPMVAGFVGRGALVPVTVLSSRPDGVCEVDLAGERLAVRGRARPGPGLLCLRPENLSAAASESPGGIRARVADASYRGDGYLVALVLEHLPDIPLGVVMRNAPVQGEMMTLTVTGGWVMPDEAAAA